ncbi:MAG TPA: hypothetical protein VGY66_01840 [Gemmataceae bacterium]|jgi:hypothetical protein|nr:hypothetical protein [Gemmataceae bacterium]
MVFSFLALLIAQEARHAKSAVDLHNAFFGVGGKFAELFPTRDEREGLRKHLSIGRFSAFERFWPNRKKLHRKIASLDSPDLGSGAAQVAVAHFVTMLDESPFSTLFRPARSNLERFAASCSSKGRGTIESEIEAERTNVDGQL